MPLPQHFANLDYYPFGMQLPRPATLTISGQEYRYGFNGMEKEGEVSGDGNSYTTYFRGYNPRLGRWLSLDPIKKAKSSLYIGFGNTPTLFIDPRGDDEYRIHEDGSWCVVEAEGDHVFLRQVDGEYVKLNVTGAHCETIGDFVGQFFLAMVDASDANYITEYLDENPDMAAHLRSRMTTPGNKALAKLLGIYGDVVGGLNVIETAYDVYTGGVSVSVKTGAKHAIKKVVMIWFTKKGAKKVTEYTLKQKWQSVKTWGHAFLEHGKNLKQSLIDDARKTNKPQGWWQDNQAAADFLWDKLDDLDVGENIVDIPEGLGKVIMPDGKILEATQAIIVKTKEGATNFLRTAYPKIIDKK